jgi:hypothetical protein
LLLIVRCAPRRDHEVQPAAFRPFQLFRLTGRGAPSLAGDAACVSFSPSRFALCSICSLKLTRASAGGLVDSRMMRILASNPGSQSRLLVIATVAAEGIEVSGPVAVEASAYCQLRYIPRT